MSALAIWGIETAVAGTSVGAVTSVGASKSVGAGVGSVGSRVSLAVVGAGGDSPNTCMSALTIGTGVDSAVAGAYAGAAKSVGASQSDGAGVGSVGARESLAVVGAGVDSLITDWCVIPDGAAVGASKRARNEETGSEETCEATIGSLRLASAVSNRCPLGSLGSVTAREACVAERCRRRAVAVVVAVVRQAWAS